MNITYIKKPITEEEAREDIRGDIIAGILVIFLIGVSVFIFSMII